MEVRVTFVDGTVIEMTVPSDVLICNFIRMAWAEANTSSRVKTVEFL